MAVVQALKKMKQIQKAEDQKVKEDKETLKQADQQ